MKKYSPVGLIFIMVLFLGWAASSAQGAEKTLRCWRCRKTFIIPTSQHGEATCPNCGSRCMIKPPTPPPTPKPIPSPSPVPGSEPASISWKDGMKHVGRNKSVKGAIVATHLSSRSGNLYLNFDSDYTTYISIKIPAEDLKKFPPGPETYYKGKTVVATGKIVKEKKYSRMIVTDPANLFVVE